MIVVTHRIATVRDCDRILYLDGGKAQALGSFDEICAAVPEFDAPGRALRLARAR